MAAVHMTEDMESAMQLQGVETNRHKNRVLCSRLEREFKKWVNK